MITDIISSPSQQDVQVHITNWNSLLGGMKTVFLHFHLGVVDEILQRVYTGIIVLEFSIVGHYPCSRIMRADHTADINRLDVGEVRKDPCARCTGGLQATQ